MTTKPTVEQILEVMKSRFTSGNSVPVERAAIRREEWDVLVSFIAKCKRELKN